ncbi:hypothetical protein LN650_23390 [Klebsiella pneumoniae subsp. pneumoniae]|nr:hypothetical protein [Klebsiella pneumoniae subsp. pneumoniae]
MLARSSIRADSGSATSTVTPLPLLGNPAAIEAAGIRVIHQELEPDPALYRRGIGVSWPGVSHPLRELDRRRMKAATAQFFQRKLAAGDRPRTVGCATWFA